MGIVSYGQHPESPIISINEKKTKITEKYRVIVALHSDDDTEILSVFPNKGAEHGQRLGFFLRDISLQRQDANSLVWNVDLVWETPDAEDNTTGQESDDPTLELPSIKVSGEDIEEACEYFFDGGNSPYAAILRNSAGDIYPNGVTRKKSLLVLTIGINYAITFDALGVFYSYGNSVNSDSWFGFPAGTVLMSAPSIERKTKTLESNTILPYLSVEYCFKVNPMGWDATLLDIGSHFVDYSFSGNDQQQNAVLKKWPFIDSLGHTFLGLLDGQGGRLCDEDEEPCTANPVYLPTRLKYHRMPFGALGLPESFMDYRGWNL